MTLDLHISELEGVRYACALSDVKCSVAETPYDGIVRVTITSYGKEISPALAWRLCASAEAKTRCLNNERHQLSEDEMMPQPNDVIITVERLTDVLP